MAKLTMTVHEVYQEMRAAGIPCSPMRISAGIESGLYPFGIVINKGKTERRTLLIYRVDFEAWLRSKMPEAARDNSSPLRLVGSM